MKPEEFRKAGYAAIDWIVDYWTNIERYPVLSQAEPGEVRSMLDPHPPETAEPFERILSDVNRVILPGITHWQSPSFFAYFPANASGPAVLGELLSAGLGVQGMLWATSPACTELETHILDWLVEMLGLPARFSTESRGGGTIEDSASSSTLVALLAARERTTAGAGNDRGLDRTLIAYTSSQGHSSIHKAMMIAGLGIENLRLIDVDDSFAMRPDALEAQIAADIDAGLVPAFVAATIGTTSSTAVDPIAALADICERHGLWLHVDAAYAGTAALLPEMRWILDGVERADSFCFNPHKWMLTNFDCSAFFVADRSSLINALSILPEYLKNTATESGSVIDYRDWQIPLGRRFRALKLWFVIRHFGVEGLRDHVRRHIRLAQDFAGLLDADPDFEIAAPHPFSLICFRHKGGDEINRAILDRVNGSGDAYLTHTRLDDRLTLRLAIGSPGTERRHIEAVWNAIRDAAMEGS